MVEYVDGSKEWRVNGKLHRADRPAVESRSGYKEWWLNGKEYSYEEWLEIIPNKILYTWRCYYGNG